MHLFRRFQVRYLQHVRSFVEENACDQQPRLLLAPLKSVQVE